MNAIANILEPLLRPLLAVLDRTGLFQTLRFEPRYRIAAALATLVLIAYVSSLLLSKFQRRVDKLRRVRILGRIVAFGFAIFLTWSVFGDTKFVLERAGGASDVLRSNAGFFLILAFALFLEVRFARWTPHR